MNLFASVAPTSVAPPSRLDPLELFLQADIVVQLVILGLALASIWVWTIVVSFSLRMAKVRARSRAFEQDFWESDQPETMVTGRRR
jgi:biopolymer transport protein TolQ